MVDCLSHATFSIKIFMVLFFIRDLCLFSELHIFVVLEQGELAIAFGELLRKLWAPGRTPVTPQLFKSKLARFAPQFSGFNQHDSQVRQIASCN